MTKKISKKTDLQIQVSDDERKKYELKLANFSCNLSNRKYELLEKCYRLDKAGNKPKKLNEALGELTYALMLDSGALLSCIPSKYGKQLGLLNMRQRLIEEYNCTTAAELILVDEIAAAYWRLMEYENYASRLPVTEQGYEFNQLKINIAKEARQQIEQAHRQIDVSLTMLKNLKQPQLKVSVKTDNAYFAQNQQVINEKPADEPPVETIKPK